MFFMRIWEPLFNCAQCNYPTYKLLFFKKCRYTVPSLSLFSFSLFLLLAYKTSQVVSCFCYLQKHTQSPAAPLSLPPFLRVPRPGSVPPGGPRSPRFPGGPPRSPFRPGGSFRGRPPFPFRPGMPPPGGPGGPPFRGASPPPGVIRKASLESPLSQAASIFEKVPPTQSRKSSQVMPVVSETQAYTPPSLHSESPKSHPIDPVPPFHSSQYPESPKSHPMDPMDPAAPFHSSQFSFDREEEAFSQPQQQGCTTFDQVGHHLNHDNLSGHHPDLDADFEWSNQTAKLGGYDSPGTASLASTTNLDNTDNYQNLRQLHQQATTTVSSILQSQSQSQSPPSHLHNDILQADQTAGSSTWVTRYFVSSD